MSQDQTLVTFPSPEQAARHHASTTGTTMRGGYLFSASSERLARGWAAYAAQLLAQGALVAVDGGYRLTSSTEPATSERSELEIHTAGTSSGCAAVEQDEALAPELVEDTPTAPMVEAPMHEVPPHEPVPQIAEQARQMPLPKRSTLRAPAEPLAHRSARALLPLTPTERPAPAGQPLPLPAMPPKPYRPATPPRPAALDQSDTAAVKAWTDRYVRTPDRDRWAALPTWTPLLSVPWVLVCQGDVPIEAEYVIAVSWHTHSFRSLDGWPIRRTPRYWLVGFHTSEGSKGSECPCGGERSFPTLRGALIAMADEIGSESNLRLHRLKVYRCGEDLICHDCLIAEVFGEDEKAKEDKEVCARFEALFDAGPVEGRHRCGRCEKWAKEDDRKLDRTNQWRREHQYIEPVNAVVIRGPGGAPMIREHIDTTEGRMVRDWLQGELVAQVRVDSVAEARTWLDGMDSVSARVPAHIAAKFKRLVAAVPERKKRQLPAAALLLTQACERLFVAKSGPVAAHLVTGLAQQIRAGAVLRWSEREGFILDGADGQRLAHAVTPGELGVLLSELDGRDLARAFISVRTGTLTKQIRAHLDQGESLNGFIRTALAEEVKRRESEQELLEQRAEVADAVA